MKFVLNILFVLISVIASSKNIAIADSVNQKIKIYLDCDDCNSSYFNRNLAFVDIVRDAKLAEIHIFVTKQKTASNSVEYGLNFIGFNQFADIHYELKTISPQDETDILKWERLLKIINIGLLPYLSRTPEIAKVEITHEMDTTPIIAYKDAWNHWVFRLESGSEFEGEQSKKEYSLNNSIKVDRITEYWKFKSKASYNFKKEIYKDDDETIVSKKEEAEFYSRLIYSINPRWSTGIFGDISKSSYLNLYTAANIGPAIEYNIFPWDKSDRKVFSIGYHLKANYFKYFDLTIYDKLEEWRASESLEISLILRQPWGEIENSLKGSHYFHDITKYSISLKTDIAIKVAKGLSFFLKLQTELLHDQLYLPAGETSREGILLQQTKLATNFEISGQVGLRFTFGSVYNNIINNRL